MDEDIVVEISEGVTLTINASVVDILVAMAASGLRHPRTLNRTFLGAPLLFTFADGEVEITESGSHNWPYADEPTFLFDDRGLV
jgi:hypothetical protein